MEEQIDLSCITFEDLQEEYYKLRERFSQLITINEQDTQRIHELRRSLETATAAEAYLAQELEQLTSAQTSQDDALLQKKQNEVNELKKRQTTLLTENEELHQNVADLRSENERLNQKIKELTLASRPIEISYQIPKEHLDLRERLETENLELLAKLDETHETVVKFTMSLAEKEKHIEILKDQVVCLEENLQSKRAEVDEKSHLLESAQEQVVEMNSKIAMLTSCPDTADRKGNSLFAEVDDQRQAMKQLLAAQKKNYLHMKKVCNESQHEIRRLKRENVAMHTELQACSTIFCSADKTYKEKLNERIQQLLKQNEELEKKLMFTQQELISMANDKGVVWLDSMLLFCKQETEELKKQLHSSRIQKGILEERLRNSQQDLAKWRFEALKTRCILIDRESLLTNNKISFKIFTNKDVALGSDELENAKPNLDLDYKNNLQTQCECLNKKKLPNREASEVSIIEIKDDEVELEEDKDKKIRIKTEIPKTPEIADGKETQPQTDCIAKTEIPESPESSPIMKTIANQVKIKTENSVKQELNKPNDKENKENICVSGLENETLPKLCAKNPLTEYNINNSESGVDLKPRPSILVTKRNLLDNENNSRAVHFAQSEKTNSDQSSEPKIVFQSKRTKSNVIVRRVLLSSRIKNEPGAPPSQR